MGGKHDAEANPSLGFDLANHNALFHIFNLIRDKNLFGKEVTDLAFAVGCKLFTEGIITISFLKLCDRRCLNP